MEQKLYGRSDDEGNVAILDGEGNWITRIDANVYPVGSKLSARYEHPAGITLTRADAERIGVPILC